MSAQRLRDAAKVLRERAEDATPGPWHAVVNDVRGVARVLMTPDVENFAIHGYPNDARFIATMHPGVALALADWLTEETVGRPFTAVSSRALAVADLILGDQP